MSQRPSRHQRRPSQRSFLLPDDLATVDAPAVVTQEPATEKPAEKKRNVLPPSLASPSSEVAAKDAAAGAAAKKFDG